MAMTAEEIKKEHIKYEAEKKKAIEEMNKAARFLKKFKKVLTN